MKYSWIKNIPEYKKYFNEDHQLIIDTIGIEHYFILYDYFVKARGIYFPIRTQGWDGNNDRKIITALIGEGNYLKLYKHFLGTWIYFSTAVIIKLKRVWVKENRHVNYKEASHTVDVAFRTIYKWREEDKTNYSSTKKPMSSASDFTDN